MHIDIRMSVLPHVLKKKSIIIVYFLSKYISRWGVVIFPGNI